MEIWDIYDVNHNKTGKIIDRHIEYTQDGEYHLGVIVCILDKSKELLLQQRSFNKKTFPGKWSLTGGAVLSGETSKEGAIREVQEELNIDLSNDTLFDVGYYIDRNAIIDVYVAQVEREKLSIKLQSDEVINYNWFSLNEMNNYLIDNKIAQNAIKAIKMSLAYLEL